MIRGFTCGAFDLLHAGHILMLREARQQCDYLIVGLHTDPSIERPHKNKPIQSLKERLIQLDGCKYVDQIVSYETEHEMHELLKILHINIRIVGQEYRNIELSGRDLCHQLGIKIHYNDRSHTYSSSELRERIKLSN
jgi:glycerol-3-phosphate cytidylyltransferase